MDGSRAGNQPHNAASLHFTSSCGSLAHSRDEIRGTHGSRRNQQLACILMILFSRLRAGSDPYCATNSTGCLARRFPHLSFVEIESSAIADTTVFSCFHLSLPSASALVLLQPHAHRAAFQCHERSSRAQAQTSAATGIYAISTPLTLKADNPRSSFRRLALTMLVDHEAGPATQRHRDAVRIQAAMKDAGITQIDHVLITHFHTDLCGWWRAGAPSSTSRSASFLTTAPTAKTPTSRATTLPPICKAIEGTPSPHYPSRRHHRHPRPQGGRSRCRRRTHIAAVPRIKPEPNPIAQPSVRWQYLPTPAKTPAPTACSSPSANSSFLTLATSPAQKEVALVCPNNPIGATDPYLVDHHGTELSPAPAHSSMRIHPVASVMINGAHKTGMPEAWQTVHDSPGIQDATCTCFTPPKGLTMRTTVPSLSSPIPETLHDLRWRKFQGCRLPEWCLLSITNSRTGQTKDYRRK